MNTTEPPGACTVGHRTTAAATEQAGRLPAGADRALFNIACHRMLDTTQVHRLCFPRATDQWPRRVLRALQAHGLVAKHDRRLTVTEHGRRSNLPAVWTATAKGCHRASGMPDAQGRQFKPAASPGEAMANTQSHTIAVNEVGVQVATAADGAYTARWDNEVRSIFRRTDRAERPTVYLTADAVLTIDLTAAGRPMVSPYIVELDRANAPLLDMTRTPGLADKIGLYHAYARQRDEAGPTWRSEFRPNPDHPTGGFPAVWVVIDAETPEKSATRRDTLLDVLSDKARFGDLATSPDLWVLVSTLHDLTTLGAMGPHAHTLTAPAEPGGPPGRAVVNFLGQTV